MMNKRVDNAVAAIAETLISELQNSCRQMRFQGTLILSDRTWPEADAGNLLASDFYLEKAIRRAKAELRDRKIDLVRWHFETDRLGKRRLYYVAVAMATDTRWTLPVIISLVLFTIIPAWFLHGGEVSFRRSDAL